MIEIIKETLQYIFENNTFFQVFSGVLVFITIILSLHLSKQIYIKFLQKKFAGDIKVKLLTEKIEDFTKTITLFDYILFPTVLFLNSINIPLNLKIILIKFNLIISVFYATRITQFILNYFFQKSNLKKHNLDKNYDSSLSNIIQISINFTLWVIAFLFFISNIGFDITSLIAGFGVGGIIIAFALQNVLADIFAYFSIYIDRPFRVGDFIIMGEDMGTVRKIGIKNTKIDHLNGQQLSIPNRTLTESNVNNYTVMSRRRIKFVIGVVYETSYEKLQKGLEIIKEIVNNTENVTLDRAHFKQFNAYSLDYEIVYYVESKEYPVYMDLNQKIQLEIKKQFAKEKISIAFPTQTLKIEK